MARRLRRPERGAAAIEFALIVPILLMLLFGIVTMGLAYSDHVALTNAVREGSRLGASAPANSSWGSSVVSQTTAVYANANNPLSATSVCAKLIHKASDGTITTVETSGGSCANEPPIPADMPEGCLVKVWANQPAHVNWILGSADITLSADSVSIYNRSLGCTP